MFATNLPNNYTSLTVNEFKAGFSHDPEALAFISTIFPRNSYNIAHFRRLFQSKYQPWCIRFFGSWSVVGRVLMAQTRNGPLRKIGMIRSLDTLERGAVARFIDRWT